MNLRQLSRFLAALAMLVPFAASAAAQSYLQEAEELRPAIQISFTPNLTPIDFTVTPESTPIGT